MSNAHVSVLKQKRFIFRGEATFQPITREAIYDSEHIFPQLEPIFDYLLNFRSYHENHIDCDGGALLCGPPGMGKTMFARYIATKSGAKFINVREFPVEIEDGTQLWQPKDISSLFRLAGTLVERSRKPVVLFIDQFDDFLKANSREVANQIELELDGFLKRGQGIFLLATSQATPDAADDDEDDDDEPDFGGSLFRRGRIGIHIRFSRPDFAQSAKLFRGFLAEHPHVADIECENLVHIFEGPTVADIKYAVSEARQMIMRRAIARGKEADARDVSISQSDLIDVLLAKVLDKDTGHRMTDEERFAVCVHELGHYLVRRAFGLPVNFVSVRSGFKTLGITFGNEELNQYSHEYLRRRIAAAAGGWEAEHICGLPPNTGKMQDLENVEMLIEELISMGERKHLKKYDMLEMDRHLPKGQSIQMSQQALRALEKDSARLFRKGRKLARKALRFFCKKRIKKIARALFRHPQGIMLQKELDALLEPQLSEFHKRYNIADMMKAKA